MAKCLAVLRENLDLVEWRRKWAQDWYWRMQCEGNRDAVVGRGWIGRVVSFSVFLGVRCEV